MDVSIIIVNYNTFALTKVAIESVFEKIEGIAYEVIVVDNSSPDKSGILLQEYFGLKITYIQSPENVGFGRANNLGIEQAKGRNVFLLNSDTILKNNAVKILSDYLDHNPTVGVCGGNLYDVSMHPVHSFARFLPSFFWELDVFFMRNLSKIRYGRNRIFNHTNRPMNVGYITGADMMIRKTALHDAGIFDADFFMYYEDAELTYRIRRAGYQVYSVPQAKIVHLVGESFSNEMAKLKQNLTGRRTYYQKTHSRLGKTSVKFIFTLTILLHYSYAIIRGNKQKRQYWSFVRRNM